MSSPDAASKHELRTRFGTLRSTMSEPDREAARTLVRSLVLDRCRAEGWTCVAAYVPLRTEPGSRELLDDLASVGVRVLVPITLADNALDWTSWPDRSLALGPAAVGEADAVLVPALAVAADGTRLGRGGGSYDRALLRRAPGALVAALVFEGETVPSLPREPWDVPVTAVVSPSGWVAVGGERNTGVGNEI